MGVAFTAGPWMCSAADGVDAAADGFGADQLTFADGHVAELRGLRASSLIEVQDSVSCGWCGWEWLAALKQACGCFQTAIKRSDHNLADDVVVELVRLGHLRIHAFTSLVLGVLNCIAK